MRTWFLYTITVLLFLACSGDNADFEPQKLEPPADTRQQVPLLTRAEDIDNMESLQAGLYMVNYQNGKPDVLQTTNNYVNNQLLTWANEAWTAAMPIYWSDDDIPADFYAYAPYESEVTDAHKMPFSVKTDQRSDETFAQSDFLWGAVLGQSPTATNFELTLKHQLSRLTVIVSSGAGFAEGELQVSDVNVTIGGTRTAATIDLQTAAITLIGDSKADVQCHSDGNLAYSAILLPQQVPFVNLIQVDWQGNTYTLQNAFTLEAQRQYTLTVKLNKTKNGFDIGIEGWDILPEDFGGTVG